MRFLIRPLDTYERRLLLRVAFSHSGCGCGAVRSLAESLSRRRGGRGRRRRGRCRRRRRRRRERGCRDRSGRRAVVVVSIVSWVAAVSLSASSTSASSLPLRASTLSGRRVPRVGVVVGLALVVVGCRVARVPGRAVGPDVGAPDGLGFEAPENTPKRPRACRGPELAPR